jgi:hypothetical protein
LQENNKNSLNISVSFVGPGFSASFLSTTLLDRRNAYEEVNFYKCNLNEIKHISWTPIKITRVTFAFMVFKEIHQMALLTLSTATDWIFYKTNITNPVEGYLAGTNLELNQLIIYWFPDNINFLTDAIGDVHQSSKTIIIRCKLTQFRQIIARQFRVRNNNPPYDSRIGVKHLDLSECGVESIDENAFDSLRNVLELLNLSDNRLKTISMRLIETIFAFGDFKSIIFQNNSFECNCEFGHLQSALISNYGPNSHISCVGNAPYITDNCTGLQVIHSKLICLQSYTQNPNYYSKFNLKVVPAIGNLIARPPIFAGKFHLLLRSLVNNDVHNSKWGYTDQKCPRKGFLKETVKCFIFHGKENVEIPLPINEMTQICVFHLSQNPKRIGPLHCIVYRNDILLRVAVNFWPAFVGGGVIGSFLAALVLVIQKNTKPKSTPVSAEGMEMHIRTGDDAIVQLPNQNDGYHDYESIDEYIDCIP